MPGPFDIDLSNPIPPKELSVCPAVASGLIPHVPEKVLEGRGFDCPVLDGTSENYLKNFNLKLPEDFPGIAIDSREQEETRLQFPEGVHSEVVALKTGDYSLLGHENFVTVERKAWSDMLSCITIGRERFERELIRMRPLVRKWILIETDSWVSLGEPGKHTNVNVASVLNSLVSWSVVYDIHILMVPREHSWKMVLLLLNFWWLHHESLLYPSWRDFLDTPLGEASKLVLKSKSDKDIAERLAFGI